MREYTHRHQSTELIYANVNIRAEKKYTHKGKDKVFYGKEPPSGESTTTECGVNCQLLAAITEVAQWGTHGCS